MSHQRLFPSFPVPHVGHFCPAGRVPVPPWIAGWWTFSPFVTGEGGDYLKSRIFERGGTNVKGTSALLEAIVKWTYDVGTTNWCTSGGDIDNDGYGEILVAKNNYTFICLEHDGTLKFTSPTLAGSVPAQITLYDFNGDGKIDSLLVPDGVNLYCFETDGQIIRWQIAIAWGRQQVIFDVDGDGGLEIVTGDASYVYCLSTDGTVEWQTATDGRALYCVADIDGDGIVEIILGCFGDKKVKCIRGTDGTIEWTFTPVNISAVNVAIKDVDGDGLYEIIDWGYATVTPTPLYCLEHNGIEKWSVDLVALARSGEPIVYDIDKDGVIEIVLPTDELRCRSSIDGSAIWTASPGLGRGGASCGDVDGDGLYELIGVHRIDIVFRCFEPDGTLKWEYAPVTTAVRDVADIPILHDLDKDGAMELYGNCVDAKIYCLWKG